ncbi:MAG: CmcJ/NvfI family oxidoreductase [Hyphomicrobiales bacterium]
MASRVQTDVARTGEFTYLAASTDSSLYRNGKVFTRRDGSGNDSRWEGADLKQWQMPVHDARRLAGPQRLTLEANGFEMLERPMAGRSIDFLDHDQVVRRYYPQCTDIIRAASGASIVAAFDHNVRSVSGNQSQRHIEGGQQVQPPLHMVHGDYTLTSAPQRLRDLGRPPTSNDTYRTLLADGETLLDEADVERVLDSGRFAIINLWRNIACEPVAAHPLALCDAASVHPDDLVVFEIHYTDRIGENYYAKHSDDHQWYFYSALTRDEALLIKQWDSAGELARSQGTNADAMSPGAPCTFSFHSAFEDLTQPPDAPDRWSIEVRCIALHD